MTKEESLAFLNECIEELKNSGEEDRKRMRRIYDEEKEKSKKQSDALDDEFIFIFGNKNSHR